MFHYCYRTLDLQNNKLSGKLFPRMFSNAQFLTTLDLSSNTITDIPDDLFHKNPFLKVTLNSTYHSNLLVKIALLQNITSWVCETGFIEKNELSHHHGILV